MIPFDVQQSVITLKNIMISKESDDKSTVIQATVRCFAINNSYEGTFFLVPGNIRSLLKKKQAPHLESVKKEKIFSVAQPSFCWVMILWSETEAFHSTV